MKYDFKDTQVRVRKFIVLKGDRADFEIAVWLEAQHFDLTVEQMERIHTLRATGLSGTRIAQVLKIRPWRIYQVFQYTRNI